MEHARQLLVWLVLSQYLYWVFLRETTHLARALHMPQNYFINVVSCSTVVVNTYKTALQPYTKNRKMAIAQKFPLIISGAILMPHLTAPYVKLHQILAKICMRLKLPFAQYCQSWTSRGKLITTSNKIQLGLHTAGFILVCDALSFGR